MTWSEGRMVGCDQMSSEKDEPDQNKSLSEIRQYTESLANIGFSMIGNARVTAEGIEQTTGGTAKNTVDLHRAIRALKYWAELDSSDNNIFNSYTAKVSSCYKLLY
jgi:hypothetical protein